MTPEEAIETMIELEKATGRLRTPEETEAERRELWKFYESFMASSGDTGDPADDQPNVR